MRMPTSRTSTASLLFVWLLSIILVRPSQAQESPSLHVTKFNSSVSYRTNVCARQRAVWEGVLSLPDALRGLNLTTVITNYRVPDEDKYFTLVQTDDQGKHNESVTPHIRRDDPGLFAVILDEVAHRAGFNWRNSFAVASPLNKTIDGEDKSWTDILKWGVDTFDISMEKWGRSISRSEMGISFPAGWWDSSIVLVERVQETKRDVNLWSFLSPFTPVVWITIVAAIIFTGLMYWCLEYLDVKADERDLDDKPVACIYYAALVFVGALEFCPKTHSARILSWSWTFWAVIVGSAYTANMASFLVSPQVDVYRISTIEQAMALDAKICVQAGGVLINILEERYGKGALNLVGKDSEAGIFRGLRDGSCQVAAHQMNTFRIYEKNLDVNHDCTLSSEKRVVQPVPAGMATAIDTGAVHCTSLISHVLDYHLTKMISEGFVEKALKMHLGKIGTIECIAEPSRGGDFGGDTFSLGMQDIGGIFIMHGATLVVALAVSFFQFYYFQTSNKTLSEIFFVKQTKGKLRSARESLRRSSVTGSERQPDPDVITTDHASTAATIASAAPRMSPRRASGSSYISPFGSGALSAYSSGPYSSNDEFSQDGSSSAMGMGNLSSDLTPAAFALEPVQESDREDSHHFSSSFSSIIDKHSQRSLRASSHHNLNASAKQMDAIREGGQQDGSSSHMTATMDESFSKDDPHELSALDAEIERDQARQQQKVGGFPVKSGPGDLDSTSLSLGDSSSEGSTSNPDLMAEHDPFQEEANNDDSPVPNSIRRRPVSQDDNESEGEAIDLAALDLDVSANGGGVWM